MSTCGVAKLAQRSAESLACMSSHLFAGCAVMLQGCDVHLSNSNAGFSGHRHPACILAVRPIAYRLCGDTAGMWRTAEGTMRSACTLAKEDARAPNGVARVAGTSRARWPRRCNGWRSGLWKSSHWAPARQRCAICDDKGTVGYGMSRRVVGNQKPRKHAVDMPNSLFLLALLERHACAREKHDLCHHVQGLFCFSPEVAALLNCCLIA